MLIVLSPAKTLDFENARKIQPLTHPDYTKQAKQLVSILLKYSVNDLTKLMSISSKLAELTVHRFKIWSDKLTDENSAQAICAFKGEVYTGLNVNDWDNNDFEFAQSHIRILSGLYGILRPQDIISAYRLEMGIKLRNEKGNNLYKFWDNTVVENVNSHLKSINSDVLINLASNEYYKVIKSKQLNAKVITPIFKDDKNGEYKVVSFYAKKARGLMSRFIVKNKITSPEQIKHFTENGYGYNDCLSDENNWVFTR